MNRNLIPAVLTSLVILDLLAVGVEAQSKPSQQVTVVPPAQAKSRSKLSFRLEALARSATLRAASAAEQALALSLPAQGSGSLMRDARGQLLVEIRMTDLSPAQLQALRVAGAQIVHVSERYRVVTALVNAARLTNIADLQTVQNVMEELTPMRHGATLPQRKLHESSNAPTACPQGAAVSAGDTQLHAASARSTYSIDGTGVKVGILSDSYDLWTSAPTRAITDVQTGDLPDPSTPCGFLTAVSVISESVTSGDVIDEGRAMLQIVHDLAPGATLKFATAWNGLFDFADNIRALRTAGSDIIADDIFYYIEPFFQEGPVNVAISDVVASGALYFTAAGNDNRIIGGKNVASYEAPAYRPAACPPVLIPYAGPDCHDFDPGGGVNASNAFTLTNNGYVTVDFQYNEPWYDVNDDFEIFLLDDANVLVAYSQDPNFSTQVPYEIIFFQNTSGSTKRYRLVITRFAGSGTPRLKYVLMGASGLQSVQYDTSSGGDIIGPTLVGHSATRFGFSVAAVPYYDSTTPEIYTSRGPAAHYYGPVVDASPASAITPDTIQQPDFAATDGGCTTFFYGFLSGCYRFYGTSASAPHAAAVTALLKQKANLLNVPLTRGWTKFILQSTASSVSGGDVNSVGAGLLNALSATGKLVDSKFLFLPLIFR